MIRVLVVEDSLDKIDSILAVLEKSGVYTENVTIVGCVSEALEKLSLIHFDILVLDLKLPVRKSKKIPRNDAGVIILKKLADNELLVPTTVLGLTGYSELKQSQDSAFSDLDFNIYDTSVSDVWMEALAKKIGWLNNSKHIQKTVERTKVVVTIHGINTAGEWQKKLSEKKITTGKVVYKNYKYIHKSPLLLLLPVIRNRIVSHFVSDFRELTREYPNSEFYFFAHSFGTYVLANALEQLNSVNVPDIKVIALAGSVLKRSFKWSNIKSKFNISYIYNDCGVRDIPLVFSYLFAPGLGMAGRTGFYGFESGIVKNRFFSGGHSFFEESETFYEDYWIPLLDGECASFTKPTPEVQPSNVIEVILDTIKILFFLIFFIILFLLMTWF